ncbi:uncharacterized protein LOC120079741 [Benincasa hispida]|uniref:uncharacterized protein LOC120079741 n=1 Tax=Benincasa hispida TaxID=102211 RepID=UPI0018FFA4D4|nr:uncharacterized protein LOC120079741 [Benincasa hispida]
MSEGESSTPQARAYFQLEDVVFYRIVQRLAASVGLVRANLEKKYDIERFKALGAVTFEGTTDPTEAELWLDVVEKCFNVMSCPEDRKVGLATFLLQKEAEKWWKVISVRRASTDAMLWPEFKKAIKDKYCPSSFRDAKRDEFLRLTQGTMSVVEYEQKFTELSQYALPIIAEEKDRCRKFEQGLRKEIKTPVTSTANWLDFNQLVERATRVERSLADDEQLPRGSKVVVKPRDRGS